MEDKELKNLIEEMGETRVKEFIKEYTKCNAPKDKFIQYFKEYIDTRIVDSDGYRGISTQSFTYFLLDKMYGSKLDDGGYV